MHSDLPTVVDKLDWGNEVSRIAARVRACATPHVLAIHGDWGSGKTSFMRQVQLSLGGEMPSDWSIDLSEQVPQPVVDANIVTVWFDAWRYQNEAFPIIALLAEIRRQLSYVSAVKQKFEKVGTIACYTVLDSLSSIGRSIGVECIPNIEQVEKRGVQWERDNFVETAQVDSIRDRLLQTIAALLPEHEGRLVIFIDDLDRCNPRAAIRLLEGLKIYLSIPRCVFVLGINERILIDAIRDEIWAPSDTPAAELRLRASHYLEKICTDIFRLPTPTSAVKLMGHWISDEAQRNALLHALGETRCLPPNPRRLKALSNQWARFAGCKPFPDNHDERDLWAVQVLVVTYIHQFHRDIWERWHFNPDFWEEIQAWCAQKKSEISESDWAGGLKMIYKSSENGTPGLSMFPNPGDIENFWIGELICKFENLYPVDFKPFVMNAGV